MIFSSFTNGCCKATIILSYDQINKQENYFLLISFTGDVHIYIEDVARAMPRVHGYALDVYFKYGLSLYVD